jgi:hypothetical protein
VMFTIVCIFRGDGAHDLLCIVCVGCWMLDVGCWMLDVGSWLDDNVLCIYF